MNEQQYKIWWQLHRQVVVGEQLSEEEQRAYQSITSRHNFPGAPRGRRFKVGALN